MKIYCCGCEKDIDARLTDGGEIYPHRPDLSSLPFWKCDGCTNFVGCHHKTVKRTSPLGCIATPEIKNARQHIHKILDPIWKSKKMNRSEIYKILSEKIGWKYHTAMIKSVAEARVIYKIVMSIQEELNNEH